ncbi:hypothetical protein C8A03DRAFT_42530 [Achaetomium macrosporum]|uniref:Uncharacterized protein n=1 Tax=Achaetomium macrosporum TaxID=79813 RepID=A0AAN7CDS4_9PEZI|nr:hypothetical protein C8A03DRAFT_42530 [Achaetomium macrosporum]
MHPAIKLAEAPPNNSDDPRSVQQHLPTSPESRAAAKTTHEEHGLQPEGASLPVRKDTSSSVSTAATAVTSATLVSDETPGTPYSAASSPSYPTQAVFSAKDGSDVAPQRRASRRRTGPLTAVQRERAHLIRKMGACPDCRRRRVACHPNHHNMTWEEAARRFRSHQSSPQALASMAGPQLSPAPLHSRAAFTPDLREMDIDTSPSQQHVQPALSEARIRTPLPSGPRLEKTANLPPLPGFDTFRTDLQGSADRILASSFRSRYAHVSVLLVRWQDDDNLGAQSAIQELAKTFHEEYNYAVQIKSIPTASDEGRTSWLWLSEVVTDFIMDHNQRDCLKIFYYSGYTYLNGDRDTVLASSKHADPASVIRWSAIQPSFENARSDALLLMDCAYYPSYTGTRRQGMLELIAASAGEDHAELLGRSAFTRALTDQLRTRAVQPFKEPFSAAELHSKLLSLYPRMIREQNPEREVIARFPTPLIMQLSGVKTLPSILLAPLRKGEAPGAPHVGTQISMTFRLADDAFNMDSWAEWLRSMPDGIMEVRVDGPYRNTFQ